MNPDETTPPAPDSPPERVRVTAEPTPARRQMTPAIYLVGVAVLLLALVFLWRYPPAPGRTADQNQLAALQAQSAALSDRVAKLEGRPVADIAPLDARIARLEARPPVDLGPLDARITRLEARPTPDIAPLDTRLARLEARPVPDLGPLETRVASLESRPPPPPPDLSGITTQLDSLARDEKAQAGDLAALSQRLDTVAGDLGGKVAALQQQDKDLAGLAGHARRTAVVQAASAALDAGRPLGSIPDAPPALARYATEAPPTPASLRLSFPAAAEAAHQASQPAITAEQGFFGRAWTTAQQVVTVRDGDRVILGDPVAGVLAHAQQLVDAGDIAGALGVLGQLAGPAKVALADWTAQAQGLLDARAALASMAAQG